MTQVDLMVFVVCCVDGVVPSLKREKKEDRRKWLIAASRAEAL